LTTNKVIIHSQSPLQFSYLPNSNYLLQTEKL